MKTKTTYLRPSTNKLFAVFTFILIIVLNTLGKAQNNEELLNLLIEKHVISADDAASFRGDIALRQQENPKDKTFKIDVEFRPRTEYRNGFQQLRRDTTKGAFFTNQRTRINFIYEQAGKLRTVLSIQDVRIWGMSDPRALTGNLQVFEGYAEPFFNPNFSVKIGRQKIAWDNQRLFAENDWRVNGGSHDAVNFIWNSDQLHSELVGAFNQNAENIWGTNFNTSGFISSTYKSLVVNYTRFKVNNNLTLSAINSADGMQAKTNPEKIYQRFTNGGRIEYEIAGFYATVAAYSQTGQDAVGQTLKAWYLQPEIKYTAPNKLSIRLGGEIFSGQKNGPFNATSTDNSFSALYGVNHRFNGSMEYFVSKPGDFGNAGLINPYLFIIKNIGKKVELRADFHTFLSQSDYYINIKSNKAGAIISYAILDKYLGAENDWLLTYRPNAGIKLDLGFSYFIAKGALATIKKSGNSDLIPTWWYLQLTFKPQLFKSIFN